MLGISICLKVVGQGKTAIIEAKISKARRVCRLGCAVGIITLYAIYLGAKGRAIIERERKRHLLKIHSEASHTHNTAAGQTSVSADIGTNARIEKPHTRLGAPLHSADAPVVQQSDFTA